MTVRSENAFAGNCVLPCLHSPTTNNALPFLLYRGTTQVGFSGPSARFVQTFVKSIPGGDSYDVMISYTGSAASLSPANNYSEVLTFSVAVN